MYSTTWKARTKEDEARRLRPMSMGGRIFAGQEVQFCSIRKVDKVAILTSTMEIARKAYVLGDVSNRTDPKTTIAK
jgi:hypothetical protein